MPASTAYISGKDSPALIIDSTGKIISIAVEKTSSIDIPLIRALRQAATTLNSSDLKDLGLHLFVIGDSQGNFEGMGAVNNFAPSNVHVWKNPRLQVSFKPAADDYSELVLKNRNIKIFTYQDIDLASSGCVSDYLSDSQLKEDPNNIELSDLYKSLLDKYQAINFNQYQKNPPNQEYKTLLSDLHELAIKNVGLNGGPFAAAVIDRDGKLISIGCNRVFMTSDPFMHGEVSAFINALKATGQKDLSGFTLVTTSQTCIGCAETCARLAIKNIFFGNTAREVEENTSFSEGPLNPDFFSKHGISQIQIESGSDFRAFDLFAELGKKYLEKSK